MGYRLLKSLIALVGALLIAVVTFVIGGAIFVFNILFGAVVAFLSIGAVSYLALKEYLTNRSGK